MSNGLEILTGTAASPELLSPEERERNQQICVATTTFYPNWKMENIGKTEVADQLRGDLAIETIKKALQNGYQIIVVDGGSSHKFKDNLKDLGIPVAAQEETGMSASRRQAFREAAGLEGVEIICWTEPEKISMVENLKEAARLIIEDKADIVIPCRTEEGYKTYPPQQETSEKSANFWANKVLRLTVLLPEGDQDLDLFFGPRIFRNTPEILKLFLSKYELNPDSKLKNKVRPDAYLNATFLPIMVALERKLRVVGVPINYRHPLEQTKFEEGVAEFEGKRRKQKTDIVRGVVQLARFLINNPQKPSELLKLE